MGAPPGTESLPQPSVQGEAERDPTVVRVPMTLATADNGEPKRLSGAHSANVKNVRLEIQCAIHTLAGVVSSRAFVDTGAEVNLVRRGLLGEGVFVPSEVPLQILAANQTTLEGGNRETTAVLAFPGTEVGEKGAT